MQLYQSLVWELELRLQHNPIEYNGLKIVKKGSQPLSEKEFSSIKFIAEKNNFALPQVAGSIIDVSCKARDAHINKIISFVKCKTLKPFKIVINSGNGASGPVIDALNYKLKKMGVETDFVYVNHEPDPSFPNGIPNLFYTKTEVRLLML